MKTFTFLVFASLLFQSQISFSAIGAVSTATGGSGRGAIDPVDGVLINPAVISDFPDKNFSVNYSTDQYALSIVDNGKDAYFPAALVFKSIKTDLIDTQQLGLTLATYRWKKFVVGTSLSMLDYTEHSVPAVEQRYKQATLDLGATMAVTSNFGLGLVFNKVTANKIALAETEQVQQTAALGMSYIFQGFARFRFDVETAPENKTQKLVYMAGLENFINDWVVVRLGYQNNTFLDKNYFTAGLGFSGPQFGLHYAYISNVSNKTEDQHLIDLGIPF